MSRNGKEILLKWATVLAVVVWGVSAQAAVTVQLEVKSDESGLEITTRGTCASNNHPGCISNQHQGAQPINFNLVGDRNCSAGGLWQLEYVALGMAEKTVGNLTAVAASDFNADQASGRVTPAVTPNANHIQIRNSNTAAYNVWYTVYATCPNVMAPISSDPRIENDGSGIL